jgi:3-oxo-5-alpha-steroid 4-dehydrogenase 1
VPQFGLFQLVSCANLFAEVLEWFGFAVAAYPSLPALSFALWTFFNLAPRAVAHHRWYQRQFPDYPPNRRAIIPFLL